LAHPTNDWKLIEFIRPGLLADAEMPSAIINNTVVGNAGLRGAALFVASKVGVNSANNVFAFNESGIFAEASASLGLANNCIYGNSIANYQGLSAGPSDLNVDPRFRNLSVADFSLLADSELIDAGNDGALSSIQRSGPTQVYGSRIDIGAHEFGPTGTPVITGRSFVQEDGAFEIKGRGFAEQQYVLEASQDLNAWTALSTNVAQLGEILFRDAQSTNLAHRFYRVRLHSP